MRLYYGAEHAGKYKHERNCKNYAWIMHIWEAGEKVHLEGHSLGGQKIRLMGAFLRKGKKEVIDYHRAHGDE
ncbi:lipase-like domain-containing protein, partial [Staphylococcus aureus]